MATSTIKMQNATSISGITAGTNISSLEANSVCRCGNIVTGNIVFKTDVAITTANYVIASGLPSTTYRIQVVGACVAGSQGGKSTRFAIYQGNLYAYYSGTIEAGTTWNVAFAYAIR